ncbi:MAG: hypothetical protein H6Q59_1772 [Firmicutes bacterium]|nr:hypothetical protein [Bacillota bacterium]
MNIGHVHDRQLRSYILKQAWYILTTLYYTISGNVFQWNWVLFLKGKFKYLIKITLRVIVIFGPYNTIEIDVGSLKQDVQRSG